MGRDVIGQPMQNLTEVAATGLHDARHSAGFSSDEQKRLVAVKEGPTSCEPFRESSRHLLGSSELHLA